jgi:hypothetical protein
VYRLQLQHNILKHPLKPTTSFRIAEEGFVVKINIFVPRLKFQTVFIFHLRQFQSDLSGEINLIFGEK